MKQHFLYLMDIGTKTFEETYPFDIDTGLERNFNGFYESEHIRYGEANFGSPLRSQSILDSSQFKGNESVIRWRDV